MDEGPVLHEKLARFRVVDRHGKLAGRPRVFSCLESAGKAAGVPVKNILIAEEEIYEKNLGLKISTREDHVLVGKGFCRHWLQHKAPLEDEYSVLYGVVESCVRNRFDKSLVFKVRYIDESLALLSSARGCRPIRNFAEVTERVAWSGCLRYEEKVDVSSGFPLRMEIAESKCVPLVWMVPDKIRYEQLPEDRHSNGHSRPKMTLQFRGIKLEIETRKSMIPNSGLGVFIFCKSVDGMPRDSFELQNGEMLDLGTYAPLRQSDYKDCSLFLFKNFVHDGECEIWSFDTKTNETGENLYDITDDTTGKLHDEARMNILSYVNETDGVEVPSVRADHDPEGAVHYLLGHFLLEQGPLVFPMDKWVELKIDYGPTYEDVRGELISVVYGSHVMFHCILSSSASCTYDVLSEKRI